MGIQSPNPSILSRVVAKQTATSSCMLQPFGQPALSSVTGRMAPNNKAAIYFACRAEALLCLPLHHKCVSIYLHIPSSWSEPLRDPEPTTRLHQNNQTSVSRFCGRVPVKEARKRKHQSATAVQDADFVSVKKSNETSPRDLNRFSSLTSKSSHEQP